MPSTKDQQNTKNKEKIDDKKDVLNDNKAMIDGNKEIINDKKEMLGDNKMLDDNNDKPDQPIKQPKVVRIITPRKRDELNYRNTYMQMSKKTTLFGGSKKETCRIKIEIDKLWKSKSSLLKKETISQDDVKQLKKLISDTIDLAGKIRINVRDQESYDDEDVENFCKDINGLQMLFHGVVEIWSKVKDEVRKTHRASVLPEIMELSTDIASLYGEIMSLFMQRFDLNIIPILRPVHGLYYAISVHCKNNCLDRDLQMLLGAGNIYSTFLSGALGLLRSTKVLLKRLKFDDDHAYGRRKMVHGNTGDFITETSIVISQGHNHVTNEDYRQLMFKIGGIFTDIFFTVGKTKGISSSLEMGEGVVALEPIEYLGNVSYCDVIRCPMMKRADAIASLKLQDGYHFISDVFQITGSTFQCSQKITIRFPVCKAALPPSATIKVKIKCGQKWMDVGGELDDGQVTFQTQYVQAFVAVAGQRAYHREIPLTGYTYISEDDSRVRVHFPKDCFNTPVIVQFRLVQLNRSRLYTYKETSPEACYAITAVSDIIYVKFDKDVDLKEPALVHLPIVNDVEDSESDLVVLRIDNLGSIHILPAKSAMKCESTGNCYTFTVDQFNGIALAKVKRKHTKKVKGVIEEEFRLYTEDEHICNMLTFLDKGLLHVGVVKVWIECVEKRFVKRAVRKRAKEGLFEVPGSRSIDFRLCDNETVFFDLDGNIQKIREIPSEHYSIVYMSSARDNYRSFPIEPRKDPRGRQVGIINFYKAIDDVNTFLHSATVDANRFLVSLSRLPTSYSESRPGTIGRSNWSRGSTRSSVKSVRSTIQYRTMFDDIPVLCHQSLLVLASSLSIQVAQTLGSQLGLQYEDILEIKSLDQPIVVTIFEIIWQWRGKVAEPEMVDQLISGFRDINQKQIADIVAKVSKEKRALKRSDFQ